MKKHIELTGYGSGRTTTVGSLTSNLVELLSAMRADGRTLLTLAEFSDYRYVQVFVHSDGDVIGEVISNLNIQDMIAVEPWAEDKLRQIGFNEPAYGPNPNWWVRAHDDESYNDLVAKMNAAIFESLGEAPGNEVTVSTWDVDVPTGWTLDELRESMRVYVEEGTGDLDD